MLKSLAMYEYVEDELAVYVPADAQGLPFDLHSAEVGVFTQRSLLPVSRCNRKLCAGVPNVPLAKYNVSCQLSALNCQSDLRHIPHSVTMLELLYWLSSVTDLSILDLEQTFFQQEILLPLVSHPFFFVSRERLSVLIIDWPRGQTSINLS